MAIELSEEAFVLLYHLKDRLLRCQSLLATDPQRAGQELAEAITDLSEWLGPGMP